MSIGKRVKDLRKKYNISQVDLALAINVSKQTMYKYENGVVTNIPSDKIELMAEALHTTPSYLMGWTDDPNDWERIGNEAGIHPPKDYNGSYENYVKFKMCDDQGALMDPYYDSHPTEMRTTAHTVTELSSNISAVLSLTEKSHLKKYLQLMENNRKKADNYVEQLLSIQRMENDIKVQAAHNDFADDEEQQKLMQEDLDEL